MYRFIFYIEVVKEWTEMDIYEILLEVDDRIKCYVASNVMIPPTISKSYD